MNLVGVAVGLARAAFASLVARRDATARMRLARGFRWSALTVQLVCGAGAGALGGCNALQNEGVAPPPGVLAYPIALALSQSGPAAPSHLFVANSNYDLRFNAGSVQSYDLNALARRLEEGDCVDRDLDAPVPEPEPPIPELDAGADASADAGDAQEPMDAAEAAVGDAEPSDAASVDARIEPVMLPAPAPTAAARRGILCDGRHDDEPREKACCFVTPAMLDELRTSETLVDSFATGMAVAPDGKHVYVPLRSKSRLVHLDVDDEGALRCGDQSGRCRRGPAQGSAAEVEDFDYSPQPSAVVTGSMHELGIDGRGSYFVATAHEDGDLALFRTRDSDGAPELLNVIPGALPPRAVSLHFDAPSQLLYVAAALGSSVQRIGARSDLPVNDARSAAGQPPHVWLYRTESVAMRGVSFNQDVRDVLYDSREPQAGAPRHIYALARGTSGVFIQSVIFLELDSSSGDGRLARAIDAVRVGNGPNKLIQAEIGGRHLLFASCYEGGSIHVIDADRRRTVTVIYDVAGPFDMQIDVARQLLYVADFRISALRVIDIHGLFDGSPSVLPVVATLGAPYFPGTIK